MYRERWFALDVSVTRVRMLGQVMRRCNAYTSHVTFSLLQQQSSAPSRHDACPGVSYEATVAAECSGHRLGSWRGVRRAGWCWPWRC